MHVNPLAVMPQDETERSGDGVGDLLLLLRMLWRDGRLSGHELFDLRRRQVEAHSAREVRRELPHFGRHVRLRHHARIIVRTP